MNTDDPESRVNNKQLYTSYVEWCKLHRFTPLTAKGQRDDLVKKGFQKHKSNGVWGVKGLTFETV